MSSARYGNLHQASARGTDARRFAWFWMGFRGYWHDSLPIVQKINISLEHAHDNWMGVSKN